MLPVLKAPKGSCWTRGESNHQSSAAGSFAVFQLFGQTFCVPRACLRHAGHAAENFSPCDFYLPGKADREKQVVLPMLKMPGRLQAMFQLPCFETGAAGVTTAVRDAPLLLPHENAPSLSHFKLKKK